METGAAETTARGEACIAETLNRESTEWALRAHNGNYELSNRECSVSILPQALTRLMTRGTDALLPGSCLLCAGDSGCDIVCPACAADLPPLPENVCPLCALPTTHGERCGACLKDPPPFAATIALYRYEYPLDDLVQALKYGGQLGLARWFGRRLGQRLEAGAWDLALPLPLHPVRLRERGFNQSVELARSACRDLGLPVRPELVQRQRNTAAQATLKLKERHRNVRGAFDCSVDLNGQRILVFDDVMTSGSTLREFARVLKIHGAAEVTIAIVARAVHSLP